MSRPAEPGLYFEIARPAPQPSPVRSDIAGFAVRSRRGPLGTLARVEGWRECQRFFGPVTAEADGPSALKGYFTNGGEIAHVWRLAGPGVATSAAPWQVGTIVAGRFDASSPIAGGFAADRYRFEATSPGTWGDTVKVSLRYRLRGRLGSPEVDVVVRAPGEATETFRAIAPESLTAAINGGEAGGGSALVRLSVDPAAVVPLAPLPGSGSGPSLLEWEVSLSGGADDAPSSIEYGDASQALLDEPEVALLVAPDLDADLGADDRDEWIDRVLAAIDPLHDRLLLLDVPPSEADPVKAAAWIDALRGRNAGATARNAAVWHPAVLVPDPSRDPRRIPATGHVAGVVSRLDRERGPHATPANAELVEAVDVVTEWELDARESLYRAGINLVRCLPGKGLMLWGAWSASQDPSFVYVAWRRLIHRLVRAIKVMAEPLVFENNTPELRLSIWRAVQSVLMQVWRAGGLKGTRPNEAFKVVCDETNNPPEEQDLGRLWCEVAIAPAAPMEFITLKISFGEAGRVEVFT